MIRGRAEIEAITLLTRDLELSRRFYARVFEGETVYEDEVSSVFQLSNVKINLLHRAETEELIAPIQLAKVDTGSQMLFTIKVINVDLVCDDLKKHDVDILNGPIDRPWGKRTAEFSDPDGNVWEVAQEINWETSVFFSFTNVR